MHWADFEASRVVKYRGKKEKYTCAAGVTPSGVCHIGHLREVLTSFFVGKSLRDMGKNQRLI